ncbi:uncharacterized protein LY89DRAFT_682034 [Mollisia scopiformis]|uniref:Secondary alcohol dehydrogenase protein n=1 Tax=Mollisia scopiformis TaxID=149040 RepID=A0A194XJH0_MOLSC|nr:uncharacterized protein LY89DRAFT_682034 [Mollisia scopiformis]KUJ20276.1 hypothetical protein LY89DRAFT_682034 [Mollisia scopiformis]
MSNEATPIFPARFAEALKDLPLSTLHLKAAEIRNSIAHLDYSNEQLKPFADGTEPSANGQPDQDCVDAIKENETVIARMQERIALLRAEVEGRGSNWSEFQSADELKNEEGEETLLNGTGESHVGREAGEERSSAWTDGTFQTGRIVNGEVMMNNERQANGATNATSSTGGSLDDEALRRAMEERMRVLAEEGDEDEGMHL